MYVSAKGYNNFIVVTRPPSAYRSGPGPMTRSIRKRWLWSQRDRLIVRQKHGVDGRVMSNRRVFFFPARED